jgi:hypothetical protein
MIAWDEVDGGPVIGGGEMMRVDQQNKETEDREEHEKLERAGRLPMEETWWGEEEEEKQSRERENGNHINGGQGKKEAREEVEEWGQEWLWCRHWGLIFKSKRNLFIALDRRCGAVSFLPRNIDPWRIPRGRVWWRERKRGVVDPHCWWDILDRRDRRH